MGCCMLTMQDGLPHPKLLTMNHHYVTRGKTTEATNASLMQISTVGRVHPYNGPSSQMGKCKRTLGIKMCDTKKTPPSQFSYSNIINKVSVLNNKISINKYDQKSNNGNDATQVEQW